jgi:hypothetical protein
MYAGAKVYPMVSSAAGQAITGMKPMYKDITKPSTAATGFRQRFLTRATGDEISIVLTAPFQVTSLELILTTGGHR